MGNYTINAVKNCSQTKGSQRLLLLMIADAIPDDVIKRALTTRALATYCNCTERYTREMLGPLVDSGELIAFETPGRKTQYTIPLLEGEPGYDPQPCEGGDHTCTGLHTPLTVTRDELYRGVYAQFRTMQRARKEGNDSSGVTPEPQFRGGGNDSSGVPRNPSSGEGGTIVPSYPLSDPTDQPKDKPKSRKRDEIILELKTQKAETAERPRSKPAAHNTPLAIETGTRTAEQTPTPQPPAPAPAEADYGEEIGYTWRSVLAHMALSISPATIKEYLAPCHLYEDRDRPNNLTLVCRTNYQRERVDGMLNAIIQELATARHCRQEVRVVVQRIAAPIAAYAEVRQHA